MVPTILHTAHVVGNLLWLGAILAVTLVLAQKIGSAKERGALGRRVYLHIAVPAFAVVFVMGLARLLLSPGMYFVQSKYMHAKLTLALVVIAVHHIVGARAKRMASGQTDSPGPIVLMGALILSAGVGSAVLALLKPF